MRPDADHCPRHPALGPLRLFLVLCLGLAAFAAPAPAQQSPHGKLKFACEECHTSADWKQMTYPSKFKHAKTGFALKGQHESVKCTACHTTLKFAVSGKRCSDCHKDVHKAELGATCDRCHSPDSWVVPDMIQRHSKTRFSLVGAHATASCESCHKNSAQHRYVGVRTDCYGCHAPDYDGSKSPAHRAAGFSTDCASCHIVNASRWGGSFDHARTGFPLTAAHASVACAQCHPAGRPFKGTATSCSGCHMTDFTTAANPPHTGGTAFTTDCASCHNMATWHPATNFDHAKTGFTIVGAHLACTCQQCHVNNVFKGTASTCFGCHQGDFTNVKTPPHTGFPTDCSTCHSSASWHPATFDHNKTAFPLTGSHVATACASCHVNNVYKGTSTTCYNCHTGDFTNAKNPSHTGFSTSCVTCHTTTAWQPANFDHNKTAFPLAGAHTAVACAQCHVNNVYKGTATLCFTCHQTDFTNAKVPPHTGFPTDCKSCHTMVAGWRPATFDHSKTAFALTGAHVATPCASCHKNNVYKGTSALCYSCHATDFTNAKTPVAHTGFPTDCSTCHTTTVWQPASLFNHSKTNFALVGAHVATPCASCHKNNVYAGTPTTCYNCHQSDLATATSPPHTGFPQDCSTCHASTTWQPATFDHSKTAFPLVGAHMAVLCAQCHVNNVYKGTATLCFTCHQPDFTSAKTPPHTGFPTDCTTCHTMVAGWRPATFDHSKTAFPLTGAHMATPCLSCHKNNVYKGTSTLCATCHQADLATATNPPHTGFPSDCSTCHATTVWQPSTFDHSKTIFPLTGAHLATPCLSCHKNNVYVGLTTVCYTCHTTDFANTTNPRHTGFPTDCKSCHTTTAWQPASFDHSKTNFPLTGSHLTVATCAQCHINGVYAGTPMTCGNTSCHLARYNATTNPKHTSAQFGTDCQTCHNTTAWVPSTFNHTTWFPIASGRHGPGTWTLCTECHTTATDYKQFSCIQCHAHSNKTNVDNDHRGKNGYTYTATSCYTCHPRGSS
jgi:hypothetical protein